VRGALPVGLSLPRAIQKRRNIPLARYRYVSNAENIDGASGVARAQTATAAALGRGILFLSTPTPRRRTD
jgi:hypothetical protein